MDNKNQIAIILSEEETEFIYRLSAEANLSTGEFLRYIIKGLKYGVEMAENPKKAKPIIIGEYGYSLTTEDFTAFTTDINKVFTNVVQTLEKGKIKHDKSNKKPRFKKYNPMAKTA